MSVSFSEVSTLILLRVGLNFAHERRAATTPAPTVPSTRALNRISPRRLNTRTGSPSLIPRAAASLAFISSTDGRLQKLELRKLSALRANNSNGNDFLSEPFRDSLGGTNSATGSSP